MQGDERLQLGNGAGIGEGEVWGSGRGGGIRTRLRIVAMPGARKPVRDLLCVETGPVALVGDRLRAARVTITVPAVLIMVPGAAAYRAITGVIAGDTLSAIQNGFTAVFVVVALAIGLTVARVLTEREWSRP